jgi:hypothetical protein
MAWKTSGAINAECEFETYCAVNTKVAGTKPAEIHLCPLHRGVPAADIGRPQLARKLSLPTEGERATGPKLGYRGAKE